MPQLIDVRNHHLQAWIKDMVELCRPDHVVWVDGSESQLNGLRAEAVASGEILKLHPEKHPNSFYHRTHPNDVARTEDKTFICSRNKGDAGPTNNWKSPEEAYAEARGFFSGAMSGRTMYVVPFAMGPVGSPFTKIGIELTDSIYVVLNMSIMCRIGQPVLDGLGESNEFTRCLHSKGTLDADKRRILHFPEDNTIWSVNSGYGGNVLLGKKCLALRIASWMAKEEGWLAEHMLILGVEHPDGKIEYIAAAFPSACGKTNLAMLVPPEGLKHKGYKVWTVGDDIAWIRLDAEGRFRAINPEAGYFGVAPGTNSRTNPNAVATVRKNTIFTNVVLGKDGTVWWEDGDGEPPTDALDWLGRPWRPGMKDADGKSILGAHPNSRFTAPFEQCPSASPHAKDPQGVPISALVFGGRRNTLAPLVYEAFSWEHGVFIGAGMASERTAAQYGKQGEVRRDPFAMLPFCGYHMARYFQHWLDMGQAAKVLPKVFHVNWFKRGKDNTFLWPGYGDNLRVLEWILARARGEGEAVETPIGRVPAPNALDLSGLDVTTETMDELFRVDLDNWRQEADDIDRFFATLGPEVPEALRGELNALRDRLAK